MTQQSSFSMPAINLFGQGTINEAGTRLKDVGAKKTLLVTDEGLFKPGIADTIAEIIKAAGVEVEIYPKAEPNPTDQNVADGVDGLSKREAAEKGIAAIERLAKDLNIPSGFEELGAKHEDIQTLAENAMKDVTAATNPRKPRLEEVMEIIRKAM